jgi:hypothetical protein
MLTDRRRESARERFVLRLEKEASTAQAFLLRQKIVHEFEPAATSDLDTGDAKLSKNALSRGQRCGDAPPAQVGA